MQNMQQILSCTATEYLKVQPLICRINKTSLRHFKVFAVLIFLTKGVSRLLFMIIQIYWHVLIFYVAMRSSNFGQLWHSQHIYKSSKTNEPTFIYIQTTLPAISPTPVAFTQRMDRKTGGKQGIVAIAPTQNIQFRSMPTERTTRLMGTMPMVTQMMHQFLNWISPSWYSRNSP